MAVFASVIFGAIGVSAIAGGWVGFKKANSRASLIAGATSGGLMLLAAGLSAFGSAGAGLALGGFTCLALAGRFVPAYLKTRKVMPAGVMSVLAGTGLLTSLVGFFSR